MYVSKSRNQVQPIESEFFCAADLTLHSQNQQQLAIRRWRALAHQVNSERDVNRCIAN
ncbi:hypothetical protein IQ269_27075 [Tychonema sp. LEGE 07199]|uniref:hypothetical protein n=1 Tax=unclassified Tychonema TaxID=2642144 RepID=UPI00187F0F0E|nr:MULTISPECIES: hypothetical protein [unclassified Tychonema]MBE9124354.1 hypothetical protein [Tychonema sp. LEGE 07199]MBE9132530.1 hypothetical protein [Tychonema sp. LEGE 07196]